MRTLEFMITKEEITDLKNLAEIAALCCIDLNFNLSEAHKEYLAGDISRGAYEYVLSRHGSIHRALHKCGFTENHEIFDYPIKKS